MKRSNSVAVLVSVCATWFAGVAGAANYDETYTGKWRTTDDVVTGWDWTLPTDVSPAPNSGIFHFGGNTKPSGYRGNYLKLVNAAWRDLEPTEGNYDLSSITRELDSGPVMLNIRGVVKSIVDANGRPALEWAVTAPDWLNGRPATKEDLKNGYSITNYNISDSYIKGKLKALIRRIGDSKIPGHPNLKAQIVHGVSNSRGEEWNGKQANTRAAEEAMIELIAEWGSAYGKNSNKLAWLKEHPARLYDAAVGVGGMGVRGGIIERWLRSQYTPGLASQTGQILDANGYLSVDPLFVVLRQERHFADQNEEYTGAKSFLSSDAKMAQNYRMASFRALQMRRNILATPTDPVNPALDSWIGLELGQKVDRAPDAWVVLMRTWARSNGDNREIKNFERWLYQRDTNGAVTTPQLNVPHSFNASGNDLLPQHLWNVDLARSGEVIGIAVDDEFLIAGPHQVAIKVTFFDSSSEEWSLVYKKASGGTGSRSVRGGSSGKVRTATFFLDDFAAPARAKDFDFTLESANGKTPYMFVRLIRLEPGDAAPAPPSGLTILQ